MGIIRRVDKILYLDFDGVLHDDWVLVHRERGFFMATEGRTLFEWAPILEQLLKPHPDVAIVLSTSWVKVKGYPHAKAQLSHALQ